MFTLFRAYKSAQLGTTDGTRMENSEACITTGIAAEESIATTKPLAHEHPAEQKPLVSVIVPVYNVLPYLRQALDSVVGQTYQNLEIIIVDDGSTDGSSGVCDEYAKQDPRVSVIHQNNRGLSAARNVGIDSATGEYLLFLDSDDWMEPNAVDALVKEATITCADVVCCQHFTEELGTTKQPTDTHRSILTGAEAVENLICGGEVSTLAWGKLYRANTFGPTRYPEGRAYEDVATTWRVLDRALLVVSIPDFLFHYRVRKGSIAHSPTIASLADYWKAHRERLDALGGRSNEMRRKLVGYSILAIGRTWSRYLVSPKIERAEHVSTFGEMSEFAREHTEEILQESYPLTIKVLCLAGRWMSPLIWGALSAASCLRRLLRRERTYD